MCPSIRLLKHSRYVYLDSLSDFIIAPHSVSYHNTLSIAVLSFISQVVSQALRCSPCSHVPYSFRTFSIFSHFPFLPFQARSFCELYPVNRGSLLVTVCNLTEGQTKRNVPLPLPLQRGSRIRAHSRVCAYARVGRRTFNTGTRGRCIRVYCCHGSAAVLSCEQREWRIAIRRNTLHGTLCG